MPVKSGQSVTVEFVTANPTTGAAADASSTPTGTLYVNGVANAASVTVTNQATGVYKASVTLPTLASGDLVAIRISATVATIAGEGIVWQDTADTVHVSDVSAQVAAIDPLDATETQAAAAAAITAAAQLIAAQTFAAVLTTQMTESYAADGTAPTLAQAIFLIQQSLHEFAISGTTRTVKKLDGMTTAAEFTLDSETTPTSTTRTS